MKGVRLWVGGKGCWDFDSLEEAKEFVVKELDKETAEVILDAIKEIEEFLGAYDKEDTKEWLVQVFFDGFTKMGVRLSQKVIMVGFTELREYDIRKIDEVFGGNEIKIEPYFIGDTFYGFVVTAW